MTNFEQLAAMGKPIFLRYDQKAMIRRYGLTANATEMLVYYCGEHFRVIRETGDILRRDGTPAGPGEMLTIFDMLCRDREPDGLAGCWRPVRSLPGAGQSNPDDAVFSVVYTKPFEQHPDLLRKACEKLGGKPFPVGDIAYELPVFRWLPLVFQFWEGDDEFPSGIRFLWDENTLQYLHFETTYYLMLHLLERLLQEMQKLHNGTT